MHITKDRVSPNNVQYVRRGSNQIRCDLQHRHHEFESASGEVEANSTDWPTTLRFSRRAGENFRGADYAAAVEGRHRHRTRRMRFTGIVIAGTLLAATLVGLSQTVRP